MKNTNIPCYVFNTHQEAEEAIQMLSRSGFDVKTLSLVGKGYHSEEQPVGFYTAGDRIRSWGSTGAFWAGSGACCWHLLSFFYPDWGLLLWLGRLLQHCWAHWKVLWWWGACQP